MHTIGQVILKMAERDSNRIALKYKQGENWVHKTWLEYFKEVEALGAGLLSLGVKAGDRIAIMGTTRYEWALCDLAAIGIGAVVVPIYHSTILEDIVYILNNSEACTFISENQRLLEAWLPKQHECSSVQNIITMAPNSLDGSISVPELILKGRSLLEKDPGLFIKKCKTSQLDDIATIIYTSGTTGRPKGVVLGHRQLMSEVREAIPLCGVSDKDTSLCFLPFAHVMGRVEHLSHVDIGFTLAYAESIELMKKNLLEVQPTFLVAVPRIFEKIYASILAQVSTHPIKHKLFKWALEIGKKVSQLKQTRQTIPLDLLGKYILAQQLVLNKVKEAFGGEIKFVISGGAALNREIASFFHSSGILVLEGYGLTETSAAICLNTPFLYQFGTVGRPVGDVEVKIAEDGEILIRSAKVMKEYYKSPELTSEVLKEGWFYTGDIGELTTSGCLKITDRKKDLIKTAGGKYVAPQRLEELLKVNPIIGNVLIHGDSKKYIVALITVDRNFVESWAKSERITYKKWTDLCHHPRVIEKVQTAISQANRQLASWETIKKYLILPTEFSVEKGELTPSLKVKRKILDKKYAKELETLY